MSQKSKLAFLLLGAFIVMLVSFAGTCDKTGDSVDWNKVDRDWQEARDMVENAAGDLPRFGDVMKIGEKLESVTK